MKIVCSYPLPLITLQKNDFVTLLGLLLPLFSLDQVHQGFEIFKIKMRIVCKEKTARSATAPYKVQR
ncbi:hypothetical protein SAMN06264849_103325 [Melghirimyces algeriensis]|uniref:Uncharacterized protein n=1 Tax=Melghirimyces algeriensis TaxID=910412 RepID=A0A521CEY5_9BACL|nr:hypothetical protein SAMN06264849_103325 [Melghirimyces algeriensis]